MSVSELLKYYYELSKQERKALFEEIQSDLEE